MNTRGRCGSCGDELLLRRDGTVRRHTLSGTAECPGSLQPPDGTHVHRCHCGAAWDEEVNG